MTERTATRVGHSLVELIVSMSAATILLSGLFGSLFIASQAIDPDNAGSQVVRAADVLTELLDEVELAVGFPNRTVRSMTFQVADRDGDGIGEQIRYAWSGQPGDPLTRSYNGGPSRVVLDGIQRLAIDYSLQQENPRGASATALAGATPSVTAGQARATRYFVTAVHVDLQPASLAATRLHSSSKVLNRVEVAGP